MTGRARGEGRLLAALVLLGTGASIVGFLQAPARAWVGLLVASLYVVGLSLAGPLFVALQVVCGATWATAIRRVPEAMGVGLPVGAAGLALVFLLGPDLYPWRRSEVALEGFKGWWLQPGFFWGRFATYIALWTLGAAALRRALAAIEEQQHDPRTAQTRALRSATIWLVLVAPTLWLASVDWIMSLEPAWHSTIFGVYQFAGLFASGLAALTMLVLWQKRRGALAGFVRDEHLGDLGKLLFAFATFWMYVWFSQYLLVWYANIPDEAVYFVRRRAGGWLGLFYVNIALNWALPFVALLSALAKRDAAILAWVAGAMLVGRWVDLYWMVAPATGAGGPRVGPAEIGPLLVAGAVYLAGFERAFAARDPVPRRDPALAASLSYES
jgi:hypothetical protein